MHICICTHAHTQMDWHNASMAHKMGSRGMKERKKAIDIKLTKWGVGWHSKWAWLLCGGHFQSLHKCKQVLRAQSNIDSTVPRHSCQFSTGIWCRVQVLDDSDGTPECWAELRLVFSVVQPPVACVTICMSHYAVHKKITQLNCGPRIIYDSLY